MTLFLLDWAIRSTVLLALGLAGGMLLRKKPAAFRHTLLAVTLVGAAVLPVLRPLVPAWRLPVPLAQPERAAQAGPKVPTQDIDTSIAAGLPPFDAMPALPEEPAKPASPSSKPFPALPFLAGAVPLLLVLRRVLAILWMSSKARRGRRSPRLDAAVEAGSRRLSLARPAEARLLDQATCPTAMTWGHRRPMVAMPSPAEEWPAGRIAGVVMHELAHAKRGDWLVQQAAGVATSVLWFNPLAWLAFRRLRSAAECAADDLVLQAGVDPATYARHLLESVRAHPLRRTPFALAGVDTMTNSHFETRIKSIISFRGRRGGSARLAALVVAGLGLAASLTIASVAVGGAKAEPTNAQATEPIVVSNASVAFANDKLSPARAQVEAQRRKLSRERELRAEARRKKLIAALKKSVKLTARQRKALVELLDAQRAELAEMRAEEARWRAEKARRTSFLSDSMDARRKALADAIKASRLDRSADVAAAMREAEKGMAEAQRELGQTGGFKGEQEQALDEAMKALKNVDVGQIDKAVQDALRRAAEADQAQKGRAGKMSEAQSEALRQALKSFESEKSGMKQGMDQAMKQLAEAMAQLKGKSMQQGAQNRALSDAIRAMLSQKDMQLSVMRAVKEALEAAREAQKAALREALKEAADSKSKDRNPSKP